MKLPSTRSQPYTERGVSRVPCVKCGQPSRFQWRICATSAWTAVCVKCDEEINRIVATWAFGRVPAHHLIEKYKRGQE